MADALMIKIIPHSKQSPKYLLMATDLADQLGFRQDQNILLHVGLKGISMKVLVKTHPFPNRKLSLHPQLIKNLGLEKERDYSLKISDGSIYIGPLIGIMTNKQDDLGHPFGKQNFFISQLIEQAREMGAICFGFYYQDVNLKRARVNGYTYVNNTWKKVSYGLPDVIYPRESKNPVKQIEIRKGLSRAGCKFINPPWLGKWQTYKLMLKNDTLHKYLPETQLVKSFNQVETMLKKYHVVYMKPVTGSQGHRIIRIVKSNRSSPYHYQYQLNNQLVRGTAHRLTELERSLKRIAKGQSFIVQQRINLLKHQGRIADMRIMIQKNGQGQWSISGKAFRIGKVGSITSNISGGGSGCQIYKLLNKHFSSHDTEKIVKEVDYLAFEVASTLDKHHGPIGELGIDIGIDQEGRTWFIEANLKPARRVFSLIGDNQTRLVTIKKPIQYARYLAGFEK
ncbi:Endospore coat-associated protein YheC/D [Syntrophomonas zehnderi OL-4]|uniref:Endospore coat-associated protein YheC/D n=1 Tax=Syntrophomonas zehnderi OL-4 TaxID=690567 RepID=A0A0E4G8N9_9FIRM|nr:YheC/YheD family protein [Syntrophomonas zehnderi]CFW96523.1 Endospore coat-associated protein YheC/D [Syntrophomonas zehnderi OL-4]